MKNNSNELKMKEREDKGNDLELKKMAFFDKIEKYREKENNYNEEKVRLNNILQELDEKLKLSQQKDLENLNNEVENTEEMITSENENIGEIPELITEIEKTEAIKEIAVPEETVVPINTAEIEETVGIVTASNLIEDVSSPENIIQEEKPEVINNKEISNVVENDNSIINIQEAEEKNSIFKKIGLWSSSVVNKINKLKTEQPYKQIISSGIDKIIELMPKREKKIIEETMKEDIPMDFESPIVKTNYKEYLKNNIVKLVSGFKISPKIKTIIERNAKKILLTTAILSVWTSENSFITHDNIKTEITSLKNKEIMASVNTETMAIGDAETYNKLSENAKKIYLYATNKINNESYMIVDKPTATLYVINKDKKLIAQMPVLLGQTKGEGPNLANVDSDIAGNSATTPAGKYRVGRKGWSITPEDNILYGGKMLKILKTPGTTSLAIHCVYPNELVQRTKALNSPEVDDKRKSWGCINVDGNKWGYIADNFINGGTIFILPDYPEIASLNPETGRVENVNEKSDLKVENNFLAMNNINN